MPTEEEIQEVKDRCVRKRFSAKNLTTNDYQDLCECDHIDTELAQQDVVDEINRTGMIHLIPNHNEFT